MKIKPPIAASPSEDDYVAQVAAAEALPLLEGADPIALFEDWLAAASKAEPSDANAMTLATVDAQGLPDARMVLLKGVDARGFAFFTNTQSAKGLELAASPRAALVFHWKSLRRQVRVRGEVEAVDGAEADAYFASRARSAQIGAWASEQSRDLAGRHDLEKRIASFGLRFGLASVPRPPHWSGYRVRPRTIEFWRDRPFRLHERLLFERHGEAWLTRRLYP
ncbi:MAG TPA: pyridoxamine 5'-phosphate oxidase [Caulobacteraceae bacterium]|nr:pyridoxamine 5'-phosphate oxidase [Caulobacteraceae bacterium]